MSILNKTLAVLWLGKLHKILIQFLFVWRFHKLWFWYTFWQVIKEGIKGFFFPQAFVYDGKTAEKVGELGSPSAHNGGIYAVSKMLKDKQVKETQEFITICDNIHMYIPCAYNFLYKVFCVRIVENLFMRDSFRWIASLMPELFYQFVKCKYTICNSTKW